MTLNDSHFSERLKAPVNAFYHVLCLMSVQVKQSTKLPKRQAWKWASNAAGTFNPMDFTLLQNGAGSRPIALYFWG